MRQLEIDVGDLIRGFRVGYTKFNVEIYVVPRQNVSKLIEHFPSRLRTCRHVLHGARLNVVSQREVEVFERIDLYESQEVKGIYVIVPLQDETEVSIVNPTHGINFTCELRRDEAVLIICRLARFRPRMYKRKLPVALLKSLGARRIRVVASTTEVSVIRGEVYEVLDARAGDITLEVNRVTLVIERPRALLVMPWSDSMVVAQVSGSMSLYLSYLGKRVRVHDLHLRSWELAAAVIPLTSL